MKAFSLLILLCASLQFGLAQGQLASDTTSLFDETLWQIQKRRVVMEQMNFSEAEKSSFWPVYESYSRAIEFIESETLQIIIACADDSSDLNHRDVEAYSKKLLQNDLLLDRLRIQYYKKFSKALSPTQASKFMQLDDNLRMMLRVDVQNKVESSNAAQASIR